MRTRTAGSWQWPIAALAAGWLLYLLAPVLTPFVLAAMFAYFCDPLVDRMERLRMSRTFAVSLVFVAMVMALVLALLWLVPFVERQLTSFLGQLPAWYAWFQLHAAPWLQEHLGVSTTVFDPQQLVAALQAHLKEAGGAAANVIAKVSKSGLALVLWLTHVVVVPVAGFYLLRDWDLLVARVHELLPRRIEPVVARLARESDEVLGAFLRGQLAVMVVLGTLYALGLWAVGIGIGPLIGMIAGLISFVPYLGAIVGVSMGVIAALVQYQDWLHVALVLGVFGIGQTLEGYVLVPKLVGEKIGLHPVVVIFAILAGGQLFGFLGVLLALPAAAVIKVVLRYLHERYRDSALYAERRPHAAPGDVGLAVGARPASNAPAAEAMRAAADTRDPPSAPDC
ncbi:putative permease [Mizugakiibacter sediminis]|uniref:Membrane protein n=1 Tax=Mizugakiibacter sediminis TaxID=1475481 RepID=A0A0K8QNM3_9GAMM|nr:AI-2E family transporter [Mizugakiibacter sediminis]GAP66484.1 putative permease [Mizugakiibacter sediminis]